MKDKKAYTEKDIRMDAVEIEKEIEKQKEYMKKTFHIREIGIFGSIIKGEQTVGSDVDILVDFEKGHKDLFNYMKLKFFLEELLGKNVDIVTKNGIRAQLRDKIFSEVKYV